MIENFGSEIENGPVGLQQYVQCIKSSGQYSYAGVLGEEYKNYEAWLNNLTTEGTSLSRNLQRVRHSVSLSDGPSGVVSALRRIRERYLIRGL